MMMRLTVTDGGSMRSRTRAETRRYIHKVTAATIGTVTTAMTVMMPRTKDHALMSIDVIIIAVTVDELGVRSAKSLALSISNVLGQGTELDHARQAQIKTDVLIGIGHFREDTLPPRLSTAVRASHPNLKQRKISICSHHPRTIRTTARSVLPLQPTTQTH